MAESLASLHLVQSTASGFAMTLRSLIASSHSIDGQLSAVRKAYTAGNIPNTVPDGTVSFPSDPEKIKAGIELEFRCARSKSTSGSLVR